MRKINSGLAAILFLAFIVRAAGLGFGLPHLYHQDEPILVNHAMAIGVGGWNPHFFIIPPFTIYLLFLVYALMFAGGKLVGIFPDPASFGKMFLSDPTLFYLAGRFCIGVFFGVLSVYWLYRVCERFFGSRIASSASLFFAVAFLPSIHSHYIYADTPLVFFVLGMLGAFWRLLENPGTASRVCFGFFIGAAVSAKYTAVFFLPVFFVVYLFFCQTERLLAKAVTFLTVGVVSLTVFLIIAPYTIIDWNHFYAQMAIQSGVQASTGLFHHFSYSLINGVGMPILLLAGAGFLVMRRCYNLWAWTVFFQILFYYAVNIFFSQPFARYMLPVVPLICILAAFGWVTVEDVLKERAWLKRSIFGLVVLSSLIPVGYADSLFFKKDTRDICGAWIEANIPAGSVIVRDNQFYAPRLVQTPGQIKDKYLLAGASDPAKKTKLDLMMDVSRDSKTYRIYTLSENPISDDAGFMFQGPFVASESQALEKIRAEYIIANYSSLDNGVEKIKGELAGRMELLASFSPYLSDRQKSMMDPHSSTAAPDSLLDLFSRKRLGPYLEVYRVKP